METTTYLGDGVYATFTGCHIVLDLRAQDSFTKIALEPEVLSALNAFATNVGWIEQAKTQPLSGKGQHEE